MNKTNVQHAINIMTRAGKVNMCQWQDCAAGFPAVSESALHRCDTAACFAGWVAVSPEFQADGGRVLEDGEPYLYGAGGASAIARWLEAPLDLAEDLCAVNGCSRFYPVPFKDVTAEHVIEKLEELLNCE